MKISYSMLKLYSRCYSLYSFYLQTRDAVFHTAAMEYGKDKHLDFQLRIQHKLPVSDAEREIIDMADDWVSEYEFEKTIRVGQRDITIHGFLDLYSPSKNFGIEYKTGRYDELQLDFYSLFCNIYLLRDNQLVFYSPMKEKPSERLYQLLLDFVNDVKKYEINEFCSQCKIATTCQLLHNGVQMGDIDAIGLWLDNLKLQQEIAQQQLKKALEQSQKEQLEGSLYTATTNGYTVYKLKKEYTKKDLLKIVEDNELYNAIDFDNKVLGHLFPEMFEIQQRKKLIIKRRGVDENI